MGQANKIGGKNAILKNFQNQNKWHAKDTGIQLRYAEHASQNNHWKGPIKGNQPVV